MIPLNSFLIFYLVIFLVSTILDLAIDKLNVSYAKRYGNKVPKPFKGIINGRELKKINQYTQDKTNLSVIQTSVGKLIFLFIILSGILPWLGQALSGLNFIIAGLLFFTVLGFLTGIIDLPFDYYHNFVIEERYGFNMQTIKTWVLDLLKSLLISCILGGFLLSSLLFMVKYAPKTWWLWVWLIFMAFQILMTIIYPTLIAPLFNKFTKIEAPRLASKIEDLAIKEGIPLKGIYQMDATRRSRHTNAYFSGLGKAKRIVLFDTLLKSHKADEILAILAHEIGHLKRNHIKKQIVFFSVSSLGLFYLASKMITWEVMYQAFGFSEMTAFVGIFLIAVLWGPVGFFLSPVPMFISRKFERQADDYTIKILKKADAMIRALKKLAKDNLSNLRPHPLYVWINYSHPPLLERINDLEGS